MEEYPRILLYSTLAGLDVQAILLATWQFLLPFDSRQNAPFSWGGGGCQDTARKLTHVKWVSNRQSNAWA